MTERKLNNLVKKYGRLVEGCDYWNVLRRDNSIVAQAETKQELYSILVSMS